MENDFAPAAGISSEGRNLHPAGMGETALAAQAPPLLEARDLCCSFAVTTGVLRREKGKVHAVDHVSFSVHSGETLGLVGESGCGKSTVARMLMGLIPPDSGEILYEGRSVPALASGRAAPFQMVFQDPFSSLNPRMSVGESVGEPLLAKGVARIEIRRRVAEMLVQVGLNADHARRYPHQFSGGQRQRLAIARALITEPRFIVCDEAVSALDASVRAQVLNLLCSLQKSRHFSCLFISHDLAVVGHMSDSVAVMYLGRIVEKAPRDVLFAVPAHPYTRALLAAVPSMSEGRGCFVPLAGEPPSPLNPPEGCAFHTRCVRAADICRRLRPELQTVGTGHVVACHFPEQARV